MRYLLPALLLGLLLAGCGKKGAGAACELTEEGAKKCASSLCLKVQCASGATPAVCAGGNCMAGGSCASSDETCVQVPGYNAAYCVPNSACK
ncbi:MAG: hypothetical protein IT371_00730 [Deltaproteobacteria bacterium]|nr:hypothetical protein [Deltaproteobacteria bacterium]